MKKILFLSALLISTAVAFAQPCNLKKELNYRVLTGLLNQVSDSTPTIKILENTLGSVSVIRTNAGEFRLIWEEGIFVSGMTWTSAPYIDASEALFSFSWVTPAGSGSNTMDFRTNDISTWGTPYEADGYMLNIPFEIRVYYNN